MTDEVCKNFLQEAKDEQRFVEAYRVGRAQELVEHIRWKQRPPEGVVFDKDGKAVIPSELPEQSYWRRYFEGTAPRLTEDDELALKGVSWKLENKKRITPIDIHNLEQAYCKLNPLWEPDAEVEEQIKKFIRKTAEEEVAAGRFENLRIALLHYGMQKEAEELKNE
jgi:hypothetical protein